MKGKRASRCVLPRPWKSAGKIELAGDRFPRQTESREFENRNKARNRTSSVWYLFMNYGGLFIPATPSPCLLSPYHLVPEGKRRWKEEKDDVSSPRGDGRTGLNHAFRRLSDWRRRTGTPSGRSGRSSTSWPEESFNRLGSRTTSVTSSNSTAKVI